MTTDNNREPHNPGLSEKAWNNLHKVVAKLLIKHADKIAEIAEREKAENEKREGYPLVLKAKDVAEIMGVSTPTAYAYMRRSDFPSMNLPGSTKRVGRDQFFAWLDGLHKSIH